MFGEHVYAARDHSQYIDVELNERAREAVMAARGTQFIVSARGSGSTAAYGQTQMRSSMKITYIEAVTIPLPATGALAAPALLAGAVRRRRH